MSRDLYLGKAGGQALYWAQVAASKRLKISQNEAQLGTTGLSYFRDLAVHVDCCGITVRLDFEAVECKSAFSYCRVTKIETIRPGELWRPMRISTLPGYNEWLKEQGKTGK